MGYEVKAIPRFKREAKKLSKKYPRFREDLKNFTDSVPKHPTQGKAIGRGCYKIRLALTDKAGGKSGGARVITLVRVVRETVFLLSIYDKSDKESISTAELDNILKGLQE